MAHAFTADIGMVGLCGKAVPPRPATAEAARGRAPGRLQALLAALAPGRDREARRDAVLRYVQPALTGLIDGSISTIAPLFATAFATHNAKQTLLVGLAATVGAGISMGFAEGLSDDGELSGRGSPRVRGLICGLATALGGLGHTLPYLIPDVGVGDVVAGATVAAELWTIAWIRTRLMDTPMSKAVVQIVIGGAIVLAVGIAIGCA